MGGLFSPTASLNNTNNSTNNNIFSNIPSPQNTQGTALLSQSNKPRKA